MACTALHPGHDHSWTDARAQIEAPKRYRYYIYTEPEAKHDLRKLRDDELEEIRREHMDIAIPDMDARDYDK